MYKKLGVVVLTALFCVASLAPVAHAQESADDANKVRQGELAVLLVNVLGLYRFLPAAPSEQEAIAVLLANQVAPEGGWDPAKEVTRADLARIIVQAIDRANEVEEQENPQSWIDFLVSVGVPIDTVGLALTNVEPLPEPIGGNVFAAVVTTDPLKKQAVFGLPDEAETGTDVSFLVSQPLRPADVIEIITVVPAIPPRPPRVTPD